MYTAAIAFVCVIYEVKQNVLFDLFRVILLEMTTE